MPSGTLFPLEAGCGPTPTQKYVSETTKTKNKKSAQNIIYLTFSGSIVAEAFDPNRLGINDFYQVRAHAFAGFWELWDSLSLGRLKLLWNVDVAERLLAADVVDSQPLDLGQFFPVRQIDGDVFVVILAQHVRPVIKHIKQP